MSPWKAPGHDGFQAGYYQHFWGEFGPHVCDYIRGVFERGEVEEWTNLTLLVLIPKKESPQSYSDFRPISLCIVLYKLITKVIANWL